MITINDLNALTNNGDPEDKKKRLSTSQSVAAASGAGADITAYDAGKAALDRAAENVAPVQSVVQQAEAPSPTPDSPLAGALNPQMSNDVSRKGDLSRAPVSGAFNPSQVSPQTQARSTLPEGRTADESVLTDQDLQGQLNQDDIDMATLMRGLQLLQSGSTTSPEDEARIRQQAQMAGAQEGRDLRAKFGASGFGTSGLAGAVLSDAATQSALQTEQAVADERQRGRQEQLERLLAGANLAQSGRTSRQQQERHDLLQQLLIDLGAGSGTDAGTGDVFTDTMRGAGDFLGGIPGAAGDAWQDLTGNTFEDSMEIAGREVNRASRQVPWHQGYSIEEILADIFRDTGLPE